MTVLPGASAVETALVASGLAGEQYRFVGYLPRKAGELAALWQEIVAWPHPVVAFESPRRLGASLASLAAVAPERPVAVCRELTKVFEEVVRGPALELARRFSEPPKGEITLVIGASPGEAPAPIDTAAAAVSRARGCRHSAARCGRCRRPAHRLVAQSAVPLLTLAPAFVVGMDNVRVGPLLFFVVVNFEDRRYEHALVDPLRRAGGGAHWPFCGGCLDVAGRGVGSATVLTRPRRLRRGAASRRRRSGATTGAPVLAPAAGVVSFAGTVPTHGRTVTIQTADGYAVSLTHLGRVAVVRGDSVAEGAPIGVVGTSGEPEWPSSYVHLGIRVGAGADDYVDPMTLLPPRPVLPPPAAVASPAPVPEPAPAPVPTPVPTPVASPAPVVGQVATSSTTLPAPGPSLPVASSALDSATGAGRLPTSPPAVTLAPAPAAVIRPAAPSAQGPAATSGAAAGSPAVAARGPGAVSSVGACERHAGPQVIGASPLPTTNPP